MDNKFKVDKYKKEISKKHKVDLEFVDFIGAEDYGDLGKLYYFNIMDPNHPEYKGTKVIKEMDITYRISTLLQENASDGIQAELEKRSGRIKDDVTYILKILQKLQRWTGHRELSKEAKQVEDSLTKVLKTTDVVLDDMFDGLSADFKK